MKEFKGILLAILGTSILAYISILSVIGELPANSTQKASVYLAIIVFSLIVGGLTNFGSILTQRKSRKITEKATKLVRAVDERLRPVLVDSLDNELSQSAKSFEEEFEQLSLEFYVFTNIENKWRILASTKDRSSVARRISLKPDEGVIGVTASKGIPVLVKISEDGSGKVYNRQNEEIDEQKLLDPENKSKTDPSLKWISATPIFVKSASKPYDDTVVGVLSADSTLDGDGNLMKGRKFQNILDNTAMRMSPYLVVFHRIQDLDPDGLSV